MSNDVKVKISVVDYVTSEVKKINNGLNNFADGIGKTIKNFKGVGLVAGAATTAFWATAKAISSCTDAARQDALEQNKLTAALGYTSSALLGQSVALSQQYKLTSGEIVQTQRLTANYFDNEVAIAKITPAIMAMSIATGQSSETIAQQLATTIKTGKGMKQYGIDLKDCTTEEERLEKVTKFVNERFAEQAKAATELRSPVDKLSKGIEEAKGNLGSFFLELEQHPVVNAVFEYLDKKIENFNKKYSTLGSENLSVEDKKYYKNVLEDIKVVKQTIKDLEYIQGQGSINGVWDDATQKQIDETTEKLNRLTLEKERLERLSTIVDPQRDYKKEYYDNFVKPQEDATKKIEAELEKIKDKNLGKFEKERKQTEAHFKELLELAKANSIDTTKIEQLKNSELARIKSEETKFKEEENKKQIEDVRKTAEEIQNIIKKNNENRSLIEDLLLTDSQLATKNKKKSISNKYQAGIDAALALGDTGMAERLSITKGQAIVQVDNDEYNSKLNKFDDSYFESIQNKTIEGFAKEREALEAHFAEMELMYSGNVERIAEINKEKSDATKNLDNIEKKVLKENMLGHVRTTVDSLQKLTENNKKFSALNKTIAIASVTYDTIKTAAQVYKDVSAFVGKINPILGIAAGAAAAGIVGAAGAARVTQIANTKSYASGLRSSQGEYAQVHKDEMIYLPRGAEVINKRETNNIVNKNDGITITMNFQDRTSETFKVLSSDIRNGKMDNFVRELTRRAQKV